MGVEYILLNGGGTSRDNLRRFAKEVMPAFRTEPELRAGGRLAGARHLSRCAGEVDTQSVSGEGAAEATQGKPRCLHQLSRSKPTSS
jgi:hypothetical protein